MGGAKDAEGNQCVQDKPCGPDNLRYVDSIRTLFIGEDTSRRNNNYVWAFNVDTRKLSRILSVPMAAEATGLAIVPNQNGFAYITSNFQQPGEENIKNYTGTDKAEVLAGMLTVRLHLDDADEGNGALRVLAGSHLEGRLDTAAIEAWRARGPEVVCVAAAGDALLIRPLLLHASGRSTEARHRRTRP